MSKLSFNPTISFDGVAIVIAAITCALWFGALGQRVSDHSESIKHIQQIQETQGEALRVIAQNVSGLTMLVNERTLPTVKKP